MISEATKAVLAASKKKLGATNLTADARMAGCKANAERAAARATDLAPVIAELRAGGLTSLRAIAGALNARGIPTASGKREWRAVQVRRVLGRLPASS